MIYSEFEYEFPGEMGTKIIMCQCKEFIYNEHNQYEMIDFSFTVFDKDDNIIKIQYDSDIFEEIEEIAYYYLSSDEYFQGIS